jgi:tellurite resistance protein TerC
MERLPSIASPLMWVGFIAVVLLLLALDLGVLNRKAREVSPARALSWSAVWVLLSAAFGIGIAVAHGRDRALEFAAGYVLEKSLAVDNLFVIALVFRHFAIPLRYQHRVLYWGILGALVTRGLFIGLGTALIATFDWVLYAFGALLLGAGAQVAFQKQHEARTEGVIVRAVRRFVPVTRRLAGSDFWVVEGRRLKATPLVLAVATIEVSDVVFAIDSIPAVFAVTQDPFIVFSSNICAVLGMRSLYFLLAHVLGRFSLLKYGLALVLIFVGAKLLLHEVVHVPILVSIAIIVGLASISIFASWLHRLRSAHTERSGRARRPHRHGTFRKQRPA